MLNYELREFYEWASALNYGELSNYELREFY